MVSEKRRRSPRHSAHDDTNKGSSYLCSPPATATGRWFTDEMTKVFFAILYPRPCCALPGSRVSALSPSPSR